MTQYSHWEHQASSSPAKTWIFQAGCTLALPTCWGRLFTFSCTSCK